MKKFDKKYALLLQEECEFNDLYLYLQPYIEEKNAFALYLYSTFSLAEWKETGEEFDVRRINLLLSASNSGVTEASYQLACCYLYGEGISRDLKKASHFSKLALIDNSQEAILLNNSINDMLSTQH